MQVLVTINPCPSVVSSALLIKSFFHPEISKYSASFSMFSLSFKLLLSDKTYGYHFSGQPRRQDTEIDEKASNHRPSAKETSWRWTVSTLTMNTIFHLSPHHSSFTTYHTQNYRYFPPKVLIDKFLFINYKLPFY